MKNSSKMILSMVVIQLHEMRKNKTNGLPIDMEMLEAICKGIENILKAENE